MPDLDDAAVTDALDKTWAKIQTIEPKVPPAIWYLTSGRSSSCATGPWNNPDDLILRLNLKRPVMDAQGKPLVETEGDDKGKVRLQNRDGSDLLGQLLHWAAHAAAGVSTAAEGRYHSREFADAAEALGLVVKYASGVGFHPVAVSLSGYTTDMVSVKGLRQFRDEIRALDKAMKTWVPSLAEAPRQRVRGPLAMECSCTPPRTLRAQVGTALGPRIRCEACGQFFAIVPGQRYSEDDRT